VTICCVDIKYCEVVHSASKMQVFKNSLTFLKYFTTILWITATLFMDTVWL